MLKRVDDVQVSCPRDVVAVLTRKYRVVLTVTGHRFHSSFRLPMSQLRAMEEWSRRVPVAYLTVGGLTYWRFAGTWHVDDEGLDEHAVHARLSGRGVRPGGAEHERERGRAR
ncbi:MAG: hypothetical protein ACOYXW_12950 [Actinomycetota bacterium]